MDLLIGIGLHEAYIASDLKLGEPGQPYGMHTALGWTIYGKDATSQRPTRVMVNFIRQEHPPDVSCQQVLKALTGDFEDIGAPQERCMSVEDKRALDIMQKTVKEVDGHLSLGLLWKDDKVDLEDNRSMALRRLEGLKRRFMADPDLFLKYRQKMVDYIKNGYAELIPSDDEAPPGRTYYIPHHCTSALTKFRVVFDCSAVVYLVLMKRQPVE